MDSLEQLGEIKYDVLTLENKISTVQNMLLEAEQKHFNCIINASVIVDKIARENQLKLADKWKFSIVELKKSILVLKARKPEEAPES